MAYAVRKDGQGWRSVDGPDDITFEEVFSRTQPEVVAEVVIPPVSPRQIRQALTRLKLRSSVESAIQAGDQDTKDWWEFATQFERHHPMVLAMAQALKQADLQMDELWRLAASL